MPSSRVFVSIKNPQYGKSIVAQPRSFQLRGCVVGRKIGECGKSDPHDAPRESMVHTGAISAPDAYSKLTRVLLGETNAPYSGNPLDMVRMNRLAR